MPMSLSTTVDSLYRLQSADLDGAARRVVISNVTYQGIEQMTPVLHFKGQSKRLALSAHQVSQLIELTGTSLFEQWVGRTIILVPPRHRYANEIQVASPATQTNAQNMPVGLRNDRREWRFALAVVGAVTLFSAAYVAVTQFGMLTIAQGFLNQVTR